MGDFCWDCMNQHEGYFFSDVLKAEVLSPCPKCRGNEYAEQESRRRDSKVAKWNAKLDRDLGEYRTARFEDIDLDRPFEPITAGTRRISAEAQRSALRGAVKAVQDYAHSPSGWMFIWGPRGTGKSHLAAAAANVHRDIKHSVAYASVPQIVQVLYESIGDSTVDDQVKYLQDADFVVLDDLGAEYVRDWADSQLYVIMNSRYQTQRPTIITSNYTIDRLEDIYRDNSERLFRIVDRLKEAKIVSIPTSSYRGIKQDVRD